MAPLYKLYGMEVKMRILIIKVQHPGSTTSVDMDAMSETAMESGVRWTLPQAHIYSTK